MHILHHVFEWIQAFGQRLGGPGLGLIAFLDSSFLSFPTVPDLLVVTQSVSHPAWWWWYALWTSAGSTMGSVALYYAAERGGETFLRKRLHQRKIERGLKAIRRHGLLAIVVPSLMPPPMPFKIFVLLAGAAEIRAAVFALALGGSRIFRYGAEAVFALQYQDRAQEFVQHILPRASMWLGLAVLVAGGAYIWWERRHGHRHVE